MRRTGLLMLGVVTILTLSCTTSADLKSANSYIAANSEAYDQAASRVRSAKSRLSGEKLDKARQAYDDAKANFKGLSDMIEVAIRTGTPLDIAEYTRRAKDSKTAQASFVSYVDSQVTPNAITDISLIVATATKAADAGLDVYKKWKALDMETRTKYADVLAAKTPWATWENVH